MEDKERSRDRDRSRRGDKPSFFSDGSRERDRDRSADRGKRTSTNRVYVSNIPYEYRWQDLKDLFRNEVGEVSFVELFVDENNKPKGCGVVEFSDSASIKKCLEVMHRFEIKGRKLVIKEDFGTERDKYGNAVNGRRYRDRVRDVLSREQGGTWFEANQSSFMNMPNRNIANGDAKLGPTWGLSPQFLDSLGIKRPLVNRIFVANVSNFDFLKFAFIVYY